MVLDKVLYSQPLVTTLLIALQKKTKDFISPYSGPSTWALKFLVICLLLSFLETSPNNILF